nr:hypothetical protein [Anaerolineae bacterium]
MSDFSLPEEFAAEIEQSLVAQDYDQVEMATLITNGGERVYLPIQRTEAGEVVPQTIMEAVLAADINVPASTQFWVEGQVVDPGAVHVASGMRISAYGNIKGG